MHLTRSTAASRRRSLLRYLAAILIVVLGAACGDDTGNGNGGDGDGGTKGGCGSELARVECANPLKEALTLDGQVMSCSGDFSLSGGTLTLRNGSRLELGKRLFVGNGANLVAEGSASCKVTITSAKSTPAAGDWRYIQVKGDAGNASRLSHAIVEYGGENMLQLGSGAAISLDNVTFRHASGKALKLEQGEVKKLQAVSFDNIAGAAMSIHPDYAAVIDDVSIEKGSVDEPLVEVRGNPMSKAGTWDDIGYPYELFGDMRFEATVTITEGAEIWIAPDDRFFVQDGGSIRAIGTATDRITIRSAKSVPAAGDWRQFLFRSSSNNDNAFSYVDIKHGGASGNGALDVQSGATVKLTNVRFSDNETCDVSEDGTVTATGSTFISCF